MKALTQFLINLNRSNLFKNGFWGVASNFLQTFFVSLLFVIIARKYLPDVFAEFLIATSLYQLIVAFSSMGLGQWFIRSFNAQVDKIEFAGKFFKIQIYLGIIFYVINIILTYILYPQGSIRILSIVLSTNIIFDNVIYAIKNLNIAQFNQKKTAIILIIDGILKLLIGCILLITPFSILLMSLLLVLVRLVTLSLFVNIGSSNSISLRNLIDSKITLSEGRSLVLVNWRFVVISSLSIIYWRIAYIILSKYLSLQDVANYEIGFRIFSIFQILPTVAAGTVFAHFVKLNGENDLVQLRRFYNKIFVFYSVYAAISYAFITSFSTYIIPFAFGNNYVGAVNGVENMFLTALLFPTVLLQANLLVAMNLEKIDMWLNVLSLAVNLTLCIIGLSFIHSVSVVHFSIFFSFLVFHVVQDILLVRKGFASVKHCLTFYINIFILVMISYFFHDFNNSIFHFLYFTIICIAILTVNYFTIRWEKWDLIPFPPST